MLDRIFYKELYDDVRNLSDSDIDKHWVDVGIKEGRFSSLQSVVNAAGYDSVDCLVEQFSMTDYISHNGDLKFYENKTKTIIDFLMNGISELRQFSVKYYFDKDFYKSYYSDVSDFSDALAYSHWIFYGYKENRVPSGRMFFSKYGLDLNSVPETFNYKTYVLANDLDSKDFPTKWHAFIHYYESGVFNNYLTGMCEDEFVGVLFIFALSYRRKRMVDNALSLYNKIISKAQNASYCFEDIGNCYFDKKNYQAAISYYEKAINEKHNTKWSFINAIRSALNTDNYTVAMQFLKKCEELTFESKIIFEIKCQVRKVLFNVIFEEAKKYLKAGDIAKFIDCIHKIFLFYRDTNFFPQKRQRNIRENNNKVNIIALVDDVLPQCTHYRILQKQEQIEIDKSMSYSYFALKEYQDFINTVPFADIVVFYRVPALPEVTYAIEYAKYLGLPTIYEIDDLIFENDYYPDCFESYGGLISKDEYSSLASGTYLFKYALELCDFSIASTRSLVKHIEGIKGVGRCFYHPNGLSKCQEDDKGIVSIKSKKIKIFYGSGTKAHNSDFIDLVSPALLKLLCEFNNIELVIVGYLSLPDDFSFYKDRITKLSIINDYMSYYIVLSKCDINIAPLHSSFFNDCKSEIKWLEAAIFKIPSVVSGTATYCDSFSDGENLLIAKDKNEWYKKLKALIIDGDLRQKIGNCANMKAKNEYSRENLSRNLKEIISAVQKVSRQEAQKKKKNKVLIVNVFFPPQTIGGATTVVKDSVDCIIDNYDDDFEIIVFTTNNGCSEAYQLDSYFYRNVEVTRVSTPQELNMDWKYANPKIGKLFKKYLEHEQPDIVHFHCIQRLTNSIVEEVVEAGIPYVISIHDAWWISDFQFLVDDRGVIVKPDQENLKTKLPKNISLEESLKRKFVLMNSLKNAQTILPVSDSFASIYRSMGINNITTVPNGISQKRFKKINKNKHKKVRIGHIGGVSAHKGYDVLDQCLLKYCYKNIEFVVVDHALPTGSFFSKQIGYNFVRVYGIFDEPHILDLYSMLDIVLAISIWPESYGLVVREALACGLWSIVSDIGALPEPIVHGENGFIINPNSVTSLHCCLKYIDDNFDFFLQSPPYVKRWNTVEEQAAMFVAIYKKMLSSVRASRDLPWPFRTT